MSEAAGAQGKPAATWTASRELPSLGSPSSPSSWLAPCRLWGPEMSGRKEQEGEQVCVWNDQTVSRAAVGLQQRTHHVARGCGGAGGRAEAGRDGENSRGRVPVAVLAQLSLSNAAPAGLPRSPSRGLKLVPYFAYCSLGRAAGAAAQPGQRACPLTLAAEAHVLLAGCALRLPFSGLVEPNKLPIMSVHWGQEPPPTPACSSQLAAAARDRYRQAGRPVGCITCRAWVVQAGALLHDWTSSG